MCMSEMWQAENGEQKTEKKGYRFIGPLAQRSFLHGSFPKTEPRPKGAENREKRLQVHRATCAEVIPAQLLSKNGTASKRSRVGGGFSSWTLNACPVFSIAPRLCPKDLRFFLRFPWRRFLKGISGGHLNKI
ncbi:hypothetical protein AN963_29220 [Brevibacillus choshinensis]|uniref:Uncharacterized protein n=1 Tax=Brevibacillus choshinensis TaxID=54911 RepID=A0ABR5MZR2_BRECH|nr:hypothetical protein AN963_29220 [Brevibacillus choshinensis]